MLLLRTRKNLPLPFDCIYSSPDSDDSFDDEVADGDDKDNQRLVSDKRGRKHYGTTLHKITPVPKTIEEKVSERMDSMKKRLQV